MRGRQRSEVGLELLLPGVVQSLEGLVDRAVILMEEVRELRRRTEAEDKLPPVRGQLRYAVAEELGQAFLGPPQALRLDAGWRRNVPAHGAEHLADEAARRPVGQSDRAARPAHPQQLSRRLLLVWREHHTEAGQHRVEGG